MKKVVLVSILVWSSLSFAQRIPDPIPGLQAALKFCQNIRNDDKIIECVSLESGANWVTPEALPICQKQTFDDDKVTCLRGIVDREIRPEEVSVCDSMTFNDEKARCLFEIRRPFPYRTRLKVDPQPGRDAAALLCKAIFFNDDKKRCLTIMSMADLFTAEAVGFCKKQFTDTARIDCLERLQNRFIVADEVTLCRRIFTDEAQTSCLASVQRKYAKTRP